MVTLKTRMLVIVGISIIIASIVGIQSIEVSSTEAYAVEGYVPTWVKEVAMYWSADELPTSKYLNSLEWLINKGIISVDTASAEPDDPSIGTKISEMSMDIKDLSKENKKLLNQNKDLNKRLDDLESSLPVTVYRVFTPEPIDDCTLTGGFGFTTVNGWCPDGIQQYFKLTGPKQVSTSEAFIVWTVNPRGNDHCNVDFTELDSSSEYSNIWIYCDSPPMEGTPLTLFVIDDPDSGGFVEMMTIMGSP